MSSLPKFNGNTPILLLAALAAIAIIGAIVLAALRVDMPRPLAYALFALITVLTGGAVAANATNQAAKTQALIDDKTTKLADKVDETKQVVEQHTEDKSNG